MRARGPQRGESDATVKQGSETRAVASTCDGDVGRPSSRAVSLARSPIPACSNPALLFRPRTLTTSCEDYYEARSLARHVRDGGSSGSGDEVMNRLERARERRWGDRAPRKCPGAVERGGRCAHRGPRARDELRTGRRCESSTRTRSSLLSRFARPLCLQLDPLCYFLLLSVPPCPQNGRLLGVLRCAPSPFLDPEVGPTLKPR